MTNKSIQSILDELDTHVTKAIEQVAEIISDRYPDDEEACKLEAEELVLDHLNHI